VTVMYMCVYVCVILLGFTFYSMISGYVWTTFDTNSSFLVNVILSRVYNNPLEIRILM